MATEPREIKPRRSDAANGWEADVEMRHRQTQAKRTPNVIKAQEYLSEILDRVKTQDVLRRLEELDFALAVMVRNGFDMSDEHLAETKANADRICE